MTNEPAPYGAHSPDGMVRWLIERTRAAGDGWLSKRVSFLLRRLAVKRLAGRPVDIETLGAKFRLYPYNNVCEKRILFTPQYFDGLEREILARHIGPGFTFIDIGANIGAYALFVAARAGNDARILCVEPQPDVFDRLVYNVRLNPFATVKAIDCAVADKAGELTLFLEPSNSGETSMKIVGSGGASAIRVPATTLLDLVRREGFTRIDAVKLDVEGAEDVILEPFLREAPRDLWPRLMIVEDGSGRWQVDLARIVQDAGYRIVAKTKLNFVFERD
ncbi:methyltransferase [Salinarimonas ramus]|uniref:Methyltransferase n=2 Tax=Salinarimonas ramus TaxID=690164 RepID=A0A917Q554_9HYPH|nr:methyltransferase [Salinarimonas ramus]